MTPPASPSGSRTTGTRRSATEVTSHDCRNRTERTCCRQGRGSVRYSLRRFVRAGEASSGAGHACLHAPVLCLYRLLPAGSHRDCGGGCFPGSQRRFHALEFQQDVRSQHRRRIRHLDSGVRGIFRDRCGGGCARLLRAGHRRQTERSAASHDLRHLLGARPVRRCDACVRVHRHHRH